MARRWWLCAVAMAVLAEIFAVTAPAAAQNGGDVSALNVEVIRLRKAGKFAEAVPIAQRYAEAMKAKHGTDHPEYATALNNLALLYHHQGHHSEAERLYKGSLRIRETALGHNHPSIATSLNNLAGLYEAQGRLTEAEPLYRRSLRIKETALGHNDPSIATSLNNLAELYQAQGRYRDAETLYQRSLRIREAALGGNHADVGSSLGNLATLYQDLSRYADAETLYRRSLQIEEVALGRDHPSVATSLNNLAGLHEAQGRYDDAEPLYRRSLMIRERVLGSAHKVVGDSLNNLAGLYATLGRNADAKPLYERAISIFEKSLGLDHPHVATAINNLGLLHEAEGRHADAKRLLRRGLAIREKALGLDHPQVADSLNNLATVSMSLGRTSDAEPLLRRSLAIREKSFGPNHPSVGVSLNNLAELHRLQGRAAEAEVLYDRDLKIVEGTLGLDHPDAASTLHNLGLLYFEQSNWQRAADSWQRGIRIIVRRAQRDASEAGSPRQVLTGKSSSEAARSRHRFVGLVKAVHRLLPETDRPAASLIRKAFEAAQWASASEAAASLAQMAVRGASGNRALSPLVRERQDLVREWQQRDLVRATHLSQHPDKRNREVETANVARLGAIEARMDTIDNRMATEFPAYDTLSRPSTMSIEQVQAALEPDEALIQFLDTPALKPTPEETFIWIVTKTEVRWVHSDLGTKALAREVAALRCGLDATSWKSEAECRDLLKSPFSAIEAQAGAPLPFDMARAHALYKGLFGEAEDSIQGKHLLIVPSGPLTTLPFQVLITAPPKGNDLLRADWLVRTHALTVLPAVSSLQALRRTARVSTAKKPMIGFANPLLTGRDAADASRAAEARRKQSCSPGGEPIPSLPSRRASDASPVPTRDGRAELSLIRAQSPLPETADELCAVARDLGADLSEMRLGARASERSLKALSASGTLAGYRVVHFATHAFVAGQLSLAAEPGLILTPPAAATAEDDGYLTASEAANLKLDADWVILSACNTAAGGADNAEALSGLARAFFYAGARALLVSHWEVDSHAAVNLITGAANATALDNKIGRAEALRRAMLALIDSDVPHAAHPSHWAPFVVVGEGGIAK